MTQPPRQTGQTSYVMNFDAGPGKRTVLYLGAPGSGKSLRMLSWPKPILYILWDSNSRTHEDYVRSLTEEGGFEPKHQVQVIAPPDAGFFSKNVIPAIQNRQLERLASVPELSHLDVDALRETQTIALDTYSVMSQRMLMSLGGEAGQLDHADRRLVLNRLVHWTDVLTGVSRPQTGKPNFHFVAGSHEEARYNEQGNITEISPHIEGRFRLLLGNMFDTVVLSMSESKAKNRPVPGGVETEYSKEFYVLTIPPDRFRRLKGGSLPPKLPGFYQDMMEAWNNQKPKGK